MPKCVRLVDDISGPLPAPAGVAGWIRSIITVVPFSVNEGTPKSSVGALPPLKYCGFEPSKFSVKAGENLLSGSWAIAAAGIRSDSARIAESLFIFPLFYTLERQGGVSRPVPEINLFGLANILGAYLVNVVRLAPISGTPYITQLKYYIVSAGFFSGIANTGSFSKSING